MGTFPEAATHGEANVNATNGMSSLQALRAVGTANLGGKLLIDVANALDFSEGFPPTLSVCNTDSLGEQIQREFPAARVVKTLNTMNASMMIDPASLAGADHSVFMCGDDDSAKGEVTRLLESMGWTDIVDVGDITSAQGTEMMLPIWVRLLGPMDSATFNF